MDGTEEIHDDSGIGRPHAEVDHREPVGGGHAHVCIVGWRLDAEMLAEDIDVVVEIGQQDEFREVLKGVLGIARQPIFDDFLFRFHSSFRLFECKVSTFRRENMDSRSFYS